MKKSFFSIIKDLKRKKKERINSTSRVPDQGGGWGGPAPPKIKNTFGFLGNFLILSAEFLEISRKFWQKPTFSDFIHNFSGRK
jgi:hypothetical protein